MVDINEAKKLINYCGGFCGQCGMYKGRIYAKVAQEFLEIVKAGYSDWLPKFVKLDFNFNEFLKGVEYFSKKETGPYCQKPCKEGGGAPCKIRPCAKERGIEICFECKEFPCEKFSWVLKKHPDKLEDYKRYKKLGLDGLIKFYLERAEKGYASGTRKYYAITKAK
ncbi:DUF3795 domain-containing protein [candidate division WOR-3 bacterium]|nr:DUF3795 domain-containing protein [candidate division WOR-3 bacterium]